MTHVSILPPPSITALRESRQSKYTELYVENANTHRPRIVRRLEYDVHISFVCHRVNKPSTGNGV